MKGAPVSNVSQSLFCAATLRCQRCQWVRDVAVVLQMHSHPPWIACGLVGVLLGFASHHILCAGVAARLWLSSNPSKRWTEVFFLVYSPFWILWALCVLVPLQLYERCDSLGYMAIGLCAALPCIILPAMLQPRAEAEKPWHRRHWVKANVWIAIYSFVGNYFWTHYFYQVLGASYHFKSWELNKVPITLYFMTHAYFCFYHALSNVCMRRVRHAAHRHGPVAQNAATAVVVFLLAYATAFGETLTIAHFPHYRFKDKSKMYTVGSLFYAIYFFVSFPVYFTLDEVPRKTHSIGRAIADSLASGMAVMILLDLWRQAFHRPSDLSSRIGLPWTN